MSGTAVNRNVRLMAELLLEAELRHRKYEASAPEHEWSSWYAAYIVARQSGKTSDHAARDATRHVEASREHAPK